MSEETISQRFNDLADRWERETSATPTLRQKLQHPAYRAILRMGSRAVPHILDRYERLGSWFWIVTLQQIVRAPSITEDEDTDDRRTMMPAWMQW